MAHMVDGHMFVNTVVSLLRCHDSTTAVVHQDIEPIRVLLDRLRDMHCASPVTQIALHPNDTICLVLPKLLGNCHFCALDRVLRHGQHIDLGNVVLQECVDNAEADALTATRYDGDFA